MSEEDGHVFALVVLIYSTNAYCRLLYVRPSDYRLFIPVPWDLGQLILVSWLTIFFLKLSCSVLITYLLVPLIQHMIKMPYRMESRLELYVLYWSSLLSEHCFREVLISHCAEV